MVSAWCSDMFQPMAQWRSQRGMLMDYPSPPTTKKKKIMNGTAYVRIYFTQRHTMVKKKKLQTYKQ
jgi:hypothetical protein